MAKTHLTAGELLDILDRAFSVIYESDPHREHNELEGELKDVADLLREQIGGSHMGTGADVVILGDEDPGERICRCDGRLPHAPGVTCHTAPTLNEPAPGRKCGECLMNAVEIVTLGADGKCPRCGADYGEAVSRG